LAGCGVPISTVADIFATAVHAVVNFHQLDCSQDGNSCEGDEHYYDRNERFMAAGLSGSEF